MSADDLPDVRDRLFIWRSEKQRKIQAGIDAKVPDNADLRPFCIDDHLLGFGCRQTYEPRAMIAGYEISDSADVRIGLPAPESATMDANRPL